MVMENGPKPDLKLCLTDLIDSTTQLLGKLKIQLIDHRGIFFFLIYHLVITFQETGEGIVLPAS